MKYWIDDYYFSKIDAEDKAYFVGLILADGCLSSKGHSISLMLHKRDYDIVERLRDIVCPDKPIYLSRNECQVVLNSKQMYNDLVYLGLSPRKSFDAIMPCCISDKLLSHFWRGMVDGDGGLSHSSSKYRYPKLSLIGTLPIIEEFYSFCLNITGKTYSIIKDSGLFRLHLGGLSAYKVANSIYNDATIYMNRKRSIFLAWKERYSNEFGV